MPWIAFRAKITVAAPGVNLAHDSATHKIRIGCFDDLPNKLAAEDSFEPRVPLRNFQIGIADPCADYADHRFAVALRSRRVVNNLETVVKGERFHTRFIA